MDNGRTCPIAHLRRVFGLDAVAEDMLLLLALYELDPVLQSEYAELGHCSLGTRLCIGFLARLIRPEWSELLQSGRRLGEGDPLRDYRLIVVGESDQGPGWAGRSLEVHRRVVDFLSGQVGLDRSARVTARLRQPPARAEDIPYSAELGDRLIRAWRWCSEQPERGGRLLLSGPDAAAKEALLDALVAAESRPVLIINMARVIGLYENAEQSLAEHLREALLLGAIAYLDMHGTGRIFGGATGETTGGTTGEIANTAQRATLVHRMSAVLIELELPCIIGLAAEDDAPLDDDASPRIGLRVPSLDARTRASLWARFLTAAGCPAPDPAALDALAHRHVAGYATIRAAALEHAAQLATRAGPDTATDASIDLAALSASARKHQTQSLGRWSFRVQSQESWDELVVPDYTMDGLQGILRHVRCAEQVFDEWGFGRRWAADRSSSALFHGPPGTGKTMAAALIAQTLERELYRVDLSKITSHWVGETEKNLDELFEHAAINEAILLFDEADSLFARRTEVVSSTDRYANLAVNFLLQRLEQFDGVALLTSNKADDIDEAFRRRIRFSVEFPLPDRVLRARLWQRVIPAQCTIDEPIDFDTLASLYEIGGAHIKNAVLRAAFAAADGGHGLTMEVLREAADEEYRNLGKQLFAPRRRRARPDLGRSSDSR